MATTPTAEYNDDTTNDTPTKRTHHSNPHDFTSPSAYLNTEAYTPTTPHAGGDVYAPTSAGSSLSFDDSYGFGYPDFAQPQPPAQAQDERTPVVSDQQPHIPPSSYPRQPLMSPFRTEPSYPMPQYVDPGLALYPTNTGFVYPDGTPVPNYAYPYQPIPVYQPMYYPTVLQHPQPHQPAGQVYAFAGPPRSRGGSPTSTIASSNISLTRNGSTSSDPRPARQKVKLTPEDKKRIVEMAAENSSLRQEDIARMYGVDRSTISKILLSKHRWIAQPEPTAPPVPKPPKTVGGRFPAIEQALDDWIDSEIYAGRDVRDQQARDKAKDLAREIGFIEDRFKGSAKWFDKYKSRRKAAGKPMTAAMHSGYGYLPYTSAPYASGSLARSQSTLTLSSSSSESSGQPSQEQQYYQSNFAKSEPDLLHLDITPGRQRSHTMVEPGTQPPSSGKAPRDRPTPGPLLSRQNSYHGTTSPSPRRPIPLTRTNSTQGGSSLRRSRPTSLAASAFGITPITDDFSPIHSPAGSTTASFSSGSHSRQRSESSLAPFTATMSGMTISPDMSDSGDPSMGPPHLSAPLTPITPGHAAGVFPNAEYGDIQGEIQVPPMGYATMPNKHYARHQYANSGQFSDFGPGQGYPGQQDGRQWQ